MQIPRFLSNDGVLLIQNRMLPAKEQLVQAVQLLLLVSSPFDTVKTSISDLVGLDSVDIFPDIRLRIKNLETLVKRDYNVRSVVIESLEYDESTTIYDINLLIVMNDGTVIKETFYA